MKSVIIPLFAFTFGLHLFAAPTANEDYVDRQDARTYTNAVTDAATYTDAATNGAVTAARSLANAAKTGAVAQANAYTDAATNGAVAAANAYTDAAVADAKPSDYDTVKATAESAVQPADLEPYCTIEAARQMTNGLTKVTSTDVAGWGFLTGDWTGKTITAGTNTVINLGSGTRINGTDDTEIRLGGGSLSVPANMTISILGSRTLANYGIGNAYTKGEVDSLVASATPSDYNTVKANAATGAAAAGQVSQLNLGYTRLYNFSTGATNANFTATNYPPTKAEADARCHFEPEAGMDFSKVPASLQLNEYRNGEWRTVVDSRDWAVWYFKFKERQLTNEIARLKVENAALSNRVEAAKSWADRTANGIDNPMTDTVVVDRPNMWLMADYEWQKVVSGSNQCFVIRAKNVALSGGGNTNGFLEVVDAFGKPYMRIRKSAETFADPVFDEIYQDQTDGAWYVVFSNSTKPTKGGANVALSGNGDGKCILFEETDPECPAVITWPDVPESHSGHWIMKAVPKPVNGVIPSAMFFGAEIKVPGSDYVEYLKEASFGAGVRYGNNVYVPQESGNQLIFVKRND